MSHVILSLGEVLAEILREGCETDLATPGVFCGPYPSGAPAIFAWAVGRLRGHARLLAAVGDDPFGQLCVRRLREAGVDTHNIKILTDHETGTAFARYQPDGRREFLFHVARSAAAQLAVGDISETLTEGVAWLHLTGSTLVISQAVRDTCYKAIARVKEKGGRVSFDPNLRPELTGTARFRDLCAYPLAQADLVLPSGSEASLLADIDDNLEACRSLVTASRSIVLKRGASGSTIFTTSGMRDSPSINVDEVDPTGAGDCFAGALLVSLCKGASLTTSVRIANRIGALSTTVRGPMEASLSPQHLNLSGT